MKTLLAASLALALAGGAASAQYYNGNGAPVYLYSHPPQVSSFAPPSVLFDAASGAALQRNQMNELQMQLMRQQTQRQQQR